MPEFHRLAHRLEPGGKHGDHVDFLPEPTAGKF
jgi:hypothetical protein